MSMTNRAWRHGQQSKAARLGRAAHLAGGSSGKVVKADQTVALLESVIEPGDRVCLEGNNQKQADFLAQCLAKVNPQQVHDLLNFIRGPIPVFG